jgi:plastocyanin
MSKLRAGDIVAFKAVVTAVADYNSGQQIMAKLMPSGKELGWCTPREYDFKPTEFKLAVGDTVTWSQRTARDLKYTVVYLSESGQQAAVRPTNGDSVVELAQTAHLTRI